MILKIDLEPNDAIFLVKESSNHDADRTSAQCFWGYTLVTDGSFHCFTYFRSLFQLNSNLIFDLFFRDVLLIIGASNYWCSYNSVWFVGRESFSRCWDCDFRRRALSYPIALGSGLPPLSLGIGHEKNICSFFYPSIFDLSMASDEIYYQITPSFGTDFPVMIFCNSEAIFQYFNSNFTLTL